MLRTLIACTVCAFGLSAIAGEIPPKIEKLMERGELRRKERLSELMGGANVMRARLDAELQARGDFGTGVPANIIAKDHNLRITQGKIDAIQQEIDNLKAEKIVYPNITLKTSKTGDIGILVDEFGVGMTAKVARIIDETNMIAVVDSQPIWMQASTRGLKVGKHLALTMPLEVTGTTTHKSVSGGSRKFAKLTPFQFPDIDLPPQQATKSLTNRFR